MIRAMLMLLLLVVIVYAMAALAWPADIKCRWLANPESNITGYELSVGTAPGQYSRTIPVGNVTAHTLTGLDGATLYYLGLVAVDASGLKSDVAEISHVTKAAIPPLDRTGWIVTASSAEIVREDNKPENAIDGDPKTLWHTTWGLTLAPHYIRLELPRPALLSGLRYLPRQDGGTNGIVTSYQIETSTDGVDWVEAADGTWPADATAKWAALPLTEARYVRVWGNDPRMAAAEMNLEGGYSPEPPASVTLTMQGSNDLKAWTELYQMTIPKAEATQFFRIKIETP